MLFFLLTTLGEREREKPYILWWVKRSRHTRIYVRERVPIRTYEAVAAQIDPIVGLGVLTHHSLVKNDEENVVVFFVSRGRVLCVVPEKRTPPPTLLSSSPVHHVDHATE